MRKIPLIIGILILLDVAILALLNQGQNINLTYYPGKAPYSIDITYFIIALAVYSGVGVFLICLTQIMNLSYRLKKLTRNVEKASIQAEDSSDKVKSLQAKIDTLEIALKEALSKK